MKKIIYVFVVFISFGINVCAATKLKVGEKYFDDIVSAVDEAVLANESIVFQEDYDYVFNDDVLLEPIAANSEVVLDLNGHVFKSYDTLRNYGSLTILNGTFMMAGENVASLLHWGIYNYEQGRVLLDNVTIVPPYNFYITNNGNMQLKNVTIESYSSGLGGLIFNLDSGILEINDSHISGKGVIFSNTGSLTIQGGVYTNDSSNWALAKFKGNTIINGGTFFSASDFSQSWQGKDNTLVINDGNFEINGKIVDSVSDKGTDNIAIHGGKFNLHTSDCIFNLLLDQRTLNVTITGGEFIAEKASSFFKNITKDKAKLNLTFGSDDNSIKDVPTISIPNGVLMTEKYLGGFHYFDGVLMLKDKIVNVDSIPDGYNICYTKQNNGVLKASLQTKCENTSNIFKEEMPKDEVENPQTGKSYPYIVIAIGILGGIWLVYLRKKNIFFSL